MKTQFIFTVLLVITGINAQCSSKYSIQVFTKASGNAAGLKKIVREFERGLGGKDNGNDAGPLRSGRRSINWDAPGNVLPFNMPFDFFNDVATRGAIFQAAGRRFAVSNPHPAPPANDDRFSTLLPLSVSRQFRQFSKPRLFTPVKSNVVTVLFRIPATNIPANTIGFGAIFTDVDLARKTWIDFYDRKGCLIWRLFVPPRNRGLSFAGIIVRDKKNWNKTIPAIWRVVIRLGNVSITRFAKTYRPGKSSQDVVVLDDLFYGEPQKVSSKGGSSIY